MIEILLTTFKGNWKPRPKATFDNKFEAVSDEISGVKILLQCNFLATSIKRRFLK